MIDSKRKMCSKYRSQKEWLDLNLGKSTSAGEMTEEVTTV